MALIKKRASGKRRRYSLLVILISDQGVASMAERTSGSSCKSLLRQFLLLVAVALCAPRCPAADLVIEGAGGIVASIEAE
jgi:hypothetical protein